MSVSDPLSLAWRHSLGSRAARTACLWGSPTAGWECVPFTTHSNSTYENRGERRSWCAWSTLGVSQPSLRPLGHDEGWRPPCPGCVKGSSPWSAEGRDRFRLLVHRRAHPSLVNFINKERIQRGIHWCVGKVMKRSGSGSKGKAKLGVLSGSPRSGGLLDPCKKTDVIPASRRGYRVTRQGLKIETVLWDTDNNFCYKASVKDVEHTVGNWWSRLSTRRGDVRLSRWAPTREPNACTLFLALEEGHLWSLLCCAFFDVLMARSPPGESPRTYRWASWQVCYKAKRRLLCLPLFLPHHLSRAVGGWSSWA